MSEQLSEPHSNEQILRDAAYQEASTFALPRNWHQGRERVFGIAIDGPATKDRDDAIWLERNSDDTYHVTVAIADVASFMPQLPHSLAYARKRGETKYLRTSNIPMLPPRISEDVLSLHPDTAKPVFAVHMDVTEEGAVESVRFNPRSILKGESMPYGKVNWLVSEKGRREDDIMQEYYTFAQTLLQVRRDQGALAVYDTNRGIMTGMEGEILKFKPESPRAGQLIVQEFMILTNIATAEFMDRENIPGLFRNHALRPKVHDQILEMLESGNLEPHELGTVYQRARYSRQRKGHSGLNLPGYAHFTSPLRRFGDLVDQAQMAAFLDGRPYPFAPDELEAIAQHLNDVQDANRQRSYLAGSIKELRNGILERRKAQSDAGKAKHQEKKLKDPLFNKPLLEILGKYTSGHDLEEKIMARVNDKLEQKALTPAEIGQLVANFCRTIPDEIGTRLLAQLVDNAPAAMAALHAAKQTDRVREFSWRVRGNRGIVRIVDREGIIVEASMLGYENARKVVQQTTVHAIAQMCGLPAPERKETPLPEPPTFEKTPSWLAPRTNAKAILFGYVHQHIQDKPIYEVVSRSEIKGDPLPVTAAVTFTIEGKEFRFLGKGVDKTGATAMATMRALMELGILERLHDHDRKQTPKIDPKNEPLHYLSSYCKKRALSKPKYVTRHLKEEGYHAGMYIFRSLDGQKRQVAAYGRSPKEALHNATLRLLHSGFIFIPEKHPDDAPTAEDAESQAPDIPTTPSA